MSRMPTFYNPLCGGMPLFWGDEQTGELPRAVRHYVKLAAGLDETPLTEAEVTLLADYCVYFIHAPCWAMDFDGGISPFLKEVQALREKAKTLTTYDAIRQWNAEASELAIDPF
jgi:hypothetical protein